MFICLEGCWVLWGKRWLAICFVSEKTDYFHAAPTYQSDPKWPINLANLQEIKKWGIVEESKHSEQSRGSENARTKPKIAWETKNKNREASEPAVTEPINEIITETNKKWEKAIIRIIFCINSARYRTGDWILWS